MSCKRDEALYSISSLKAILSKLLDPDSRLATLQSFSISLINDNDRNLLLVLKALLCSCFDVSSLDIRLAATECLKSTLFLWPSKTIKLLVMAIEILHRDQSPAIRLATISLTTALMQNCPLNQHITQGVFHCRPRDYLFVLLCGALINDFCSRVRLAAIQAIVDQCANFLPPPALLEQCFTKDRIDRLFDFGSIEHLPPVPRRACGALIHSLEDEHKPVRLKALDFMQLIVRKTGNWSNYPGLIDCLFDALNDEAPECRLGAIESLCTLAVAENLSLSISQVEQVLCIMDDPLPSHRQAIHNFFQQSKLQFKDSESIKRFARCAAMAIHKNWREEQLVIQSCAIISQHNKTDNLLRLPPEEQSTTWEDPYNRIKAVMMLIGEKEDASNCSLPQYLKDKRSFFQRLYPMLSQLEIIK